MKWFKSKKAKAILGGVIATVAGAYGIQYNGEQGEQKRLEKFEDDRGCQCIYREEVLLPLRGGVNKK